VIDFLSPDSLFRNAVLGGLGVALLCAILGVFLVLRRLVLIGVALPQAGAAGIAAIFWLSGHGHGAAEGTHTLALAGSLIATFVALALLVAGRRGARLPAEWAVGALFAIGSALTTLFVALNPRGDIEMAGLLRGELLAIGSRDLTVLALAMLGIGGPFLAFRRELLLTSFDPEFARTIGCDPLRYDGLLYGLLGAGIAVGVMVAGPLVVFGFLVLPPLAALSLGRGLPATFAIAAAVAAAAFLSGFRIAYRVDLPAGPVCVAAAAALWLVLRLVARLGTRRAVAGALLLALALASAPLGCAQRRAAAEARATAPLPRGTLPELPPGQAIAVLRFDNATGQSLRIPSANPLQDLPRAAGDPFATPAATVVDLLQQRAAVELARRGYEVVPLERVRASLAGAPGDPRSAARLAAQTGFPGPVLQGTLRRFTITQTGLLLVRLELTLVDGRSEQVLWSGLAKRPVPIQSALTWQEVLLDAGAPIFAEAFGTR
jgi:ABC-type Mn2+/Zn2+ transport system permease subunit